MNTISFRNVREAQKYIRELSEERAAQLGDEEVWEHAPTREIKVGVDASYIAENSDSDAADDYRLLGTVSQVLY